MSLLATPALRITHVTRTLDSAAGGLPVVAMRLAAAAAEAGHLVTLVAESPATDLNLARATIPFFDAVEVRFDHPTSFGKLLQRIDFRNDPTAQFVRECDVLHLHGIWDALLVLYARLARHSRVPYIIAPHGMLDPWSLAQSRTKKLVARHTTHRSMLKHAAAFHALNDQEANLWAPLGLNASVSVIPNGIDSRELPTLDKSRIAAMRQRFNIGDKHVVLFLSRLHYKKGLDILAQAFRLLADVRDDVVLVVVGPDDGAKQAFESQIVDLQLSDKVHLTGALFGPEKYDALHLADVFCLPSRQEGFSIAILEAIATGTSVVISRDCHFDEVENAGVGLVCDLNPTSIYKALNEILDDKEKRAVVKKTGPEWISQNYSWSRINCSLVTLYLECTNSKLMKDSLKSPASTIVHQ